MQNPLHPIPSPSGNPIIGNLFSVDAKAPLQSLMELTRELGPIYWLNMMGKPMIIASGPEIVKELSDETRFDKTVRGPLRRVRSIGGDGLFTSDTKAPNWSKAHNILMPTFSQQAMVDYLPQMIDIAEQLMLKWERLNADDQVDVVRDMTGLTLDTVGLCGFDFRFNSFYREDFHPFIGALTRTLEISMLQRQIPLEDIALRSRLKQQIVDVSFMNKLVDDIISERRRSPGGQNDLLNFMLAGTDKVTGEGLSDENIRFQINTFLIAGHETTSGLLSFTLYYLLKYPDVLAKAQAEVDSVLGHDIARPPTIAQIGKLDYVRAVLSEALRLWPTAPAFSLSPYKDELVAGKYPLKKGSYITVLLPMLHRDASIWGENAEEFNPDNFSKEAEANRPPYAYKPFGNGQRACIGRQFAMQEAVLVIGMILQRFQLFDHNNYDLKIKETLSLKPDGFYIKVKPRPEVVRGESPSIVPSQEPTSAASDAYIQRPNHGTKLTVIFGSNLGSTENLAREIASAGDLNGFDTRLATLDEYTGNLPKDGAVVIASSSYNGTPPDNAAKFVEWIKTASAQEVEGVQYVVFGCGNRDWASTYQDIPRLLDDRLSELGANRLCGRVEADAREGLDGTFQPGLAEIWPKIGQALALDIDLSTPIDKPPLYNVEVTHSITANPVASTAGAVPMRVLENRELQNSEQSGRSTRHIVLELPEGLDYEPGDHLCVVGKNSATLVARALNRFGFDENSYIRVSVNGGRRSPFPSGSTFSVKRLAQVYGELQAVATQSDIATMLQHTRCPNTRSQLEALANLSDDTVYRSAVFNKRKSILDLLEELPACELPFEIYMEMIPWMVPRYYSISSSNKVNPGQCSVSVGVVEGPAFTGNGQYEGVCSTCLRDTQPGETVQAVIRKSTNQFHLPKDPMVPIVMIGPGTGVAPFMGFIQERKALQGQGASLGDAHLFFGCRHSDQDFIYRAELEQAHADNLVELHTAFSRQTDERVYVQDNIRKNWSFLWPLLNSNAVIYICGDGAMMEPDVKNTLIQLYMEETNVPLQQGQAWLEQLGRDGRYVLDVWAGG
jgi:cytochrome P450/NADPH-cytochrome P450 reductase